MNLERRISKLETTLLPEEDEKFAWSHAPMDMTDEECRELADKQLAKIFPDGDYSLEIQRGHNIDEFEVFFASTKADFQKLTKEIAASGAQIGRETNK